VLLITYSFIGTIIGLAYTLYVEYIYQLRRSTQLTHEMRLARSIQQGLFPRQCPQVEGYTLAARCRPARETGGDFYDFVEFGDGRLGIVIADVAGKGMPAALLMANARSTWRAEARNRHSPAEILRHVNRSLHQDINSNGFVTLLYAVLDPTTHQLCVSSAGHPLPLIHNDTGWREVEVYGLPLGLQPDASYDEVQIGLTPGDTVLLYTDGVTEAMNPARELFGFERLTAFLAREGYRTAGSLVERTLAVSRTFSGRAGQADDTTVMVLKVHL
jgi:serine phosphatase RsbU (regulator of sigma subunit)